MKFLQKLSIFIEHTHFVLLGSENIEFQKTGKVADFAISAKTFFFLSFLYSKFNTDTFATFSIQVGFCAFPVNFKELQLVAF